MEKQPAIYHACLNLAGLVFAVTRHFPRKANYEEGAELRHAAVSLVKDCLLANRAQRGSTERSMRQAAMADDIAMIEAMLAITAGQKCCVKAGEGQRWERLVSEKNEIKINTSVAAVGKQLYGWRRS